YLLIKNDVIYLLSDKNIVNSRIFNDLKKLPHASFGKTNDNTKYYITANLQPTVAFILRYTLKAFQIEVIGEQQKTLKILKELADTVPKPKAVLSQDKKS